MIQTFRFSFLFLIALALVHCGSSTGSSGGSTNSSTLLLPFTAGDSYELIQGFNGTFSHTGCLQYSVDFAMTEGTDIVSTAPGVVISVKEDSDSGGGDISHLDEANYINIDQGEGLYGVYAHLCQNCADVEVGDTVTQGQVIGQSGNTGFSSTPHLHYSVYSWNTDCSVSFGFSDVSDTDGIPVEGETYTSENDGSLDATYEPSSIDLDAFADNNVTLTSNIPIVLHKSETYTITGSVSDGNPMVALFLVSDGTSVDDDVEAVAVGGTFSFSYTPDASLENGSYGLAMATSSDGTYSSTFSRSVVVVE